MDTCRVNYGLTLTQAITNTEREELWQDFLRDKEKRERDAKRQVRRERASAFRDLLLSTPAIKVGLSYKRYIVLVWYRGILVAGLLEATWLRALPGLMQLKSAVADGGYEVGGSPCAR